MAAPYGLIWVVSNEDARLRTILNAFESSIRFVALCLLSAAVLDQKQRPMIREIVQRQKTSRVTLGHRRSGALSSLADDDADPIVAILREVARPTGRGVHLVKLAGQHLLPFRNYFAHDPVPPCERRAAQQALDLLHSLNELIEAFAPLRRLELISVIRTARKRHSSKAWIRVLSDARENFDVPEVSLRDQQTELYEDGCYLATTDYRSVLELFGVRRVHPMLTLFEKLDAMARRYNRDDIEPDSFVRHYEDAAQIIRAEDRLPEMPMTAAALVDDMLEQKDIAALPHKAMFALAPMRSPSYSRRHALGIRRQKGF